MRRLNSPTYIIVLIAMGLVIAVLISKGPSWLWTVLGMITIADLARKYVLRRRRTRAVAPTADR